MNNKLLSEIGENYEYVRTIVSNEIEMLKINASETISNLVGLAIVGIIASVGLLLIILGLIAALVIFLVQIFNSTIVGILLTVLVIAIVVVLLIFFRKPLFIRPIAYAIFNRYEKNSKR